MTELNQDPFDARWLNCLYEGKLAGRVKVVTSTIILIEPLLVVTLADGSRSSQFFGLRKNCPSDILIKDDYVIFSWRNVGERSYDRKRGEEGDPEAIEIEVTSKESAEELTKQLKNLLPSELRTIWNGQLKKLEDREESLNSLIEEEAANLTKEIKNEYEEKSQELSKDKEYIYEEMEKIAQTQQKIEQRELRIK
ncbi:MAG: hypothetical protein ACKO7R_12460, partial [Pseudanabaena sp.]